MDRIENEKKRINNRARRCLRPDAMKFVAIIARRLFHMASGAIEETRRFRFRFVLEPGFRLLLVDGSPQFCLNPFEVAACFFSIAEAAPSIGDTRQQLPS